MNKKIGFFDVDCRELSADGINLVFRPRVNPIADKLDTLYTMASKSQIPFIFTTCCSGKMLHDDSREDIVFVPIDKSLSLWKEKVHSCHLFYIQKKAFGDPKMNFSCRAYDVFNGNENALELLRELDVQEWVVFGNGFDLCVNSVAKNILKAGYKVTLISDIMIPSAKGYDNCGTEENRVAVFENLCAMGARKLTLDEFFDAYKIAD